METTQILLEDLLELRKKFPDKPVKIRFNKHNGVTDPFEELRLDPEHVNNDWLFWVNKRRYFKQDDIAICLVKVGSCSWLLSTIKNVDKVLPLDGPGVGYEGSEIAQFKKYFGRVVVKVKKGQALLYHYDTIKDKLCVEEIKSKDFLELGFPGYNNVCLSFKDAKKVLGKDTTWDTALANQKAVYLLTDRKTGKLYVGSAYGKSGLLTRWLSYINSGDGGNKELRELSRDYIMENFHFSILEIFNSRIDDSYIIQRESFWKNILDTRNHGYNDN